MKKISLFTLALVSGLAVYAQEQDHKPLRTPMDVKTRFGIRAGVSLANLEVDDDVTSGVVPNTNTKTSFVGGFLVNIPVGGMFRVQPELVWSGQGAKADKGSKPNTTTARMEEYDFGYIAIPLMLQLQTNGGFFVETGPQFSILMRAQEEYTDGSTVNVEDMDWVKKTDLAWGVGIGYLSRIGLGIDGRYNFGLSNVWNNEDRPAGQLNFEKMKNAAAQISLVWHFGAYK